MKKIGLKVIIFGCLFWYGLGYLHPLAAGISALSEVNLLITIFFITAISGHYLGYAATRTRTSPAASLQDYNIGPLSFLKLILIFIFGFFIFIISTTAGGMISYHSLRAMTALGILALVSATIFKGWKRLVLLSIFVAIALYSLDVYSRRPFLTLLAPILLIPLIRNRYTLSRAAWISLLISAISIAAVGYLTGARYFQENTSLFDFPLILSRGLNALLTGAGADTVHLTAYVIENYSGSNYLNGQTFLGALVNFIPRPLWPEKPIAFGLTLSGQYFNIFIEDAFTNFGPGIVAEAYANGGYLSVIFASVALGILTGISDKYIENNRYNFNTVLFAVVLYPALFFVIRGDFLNGFYELYSKSLVIWVATTCFGLNRRFRPPLQKHEREFDNSVNPQYSPNAAKGPV